MLGGRASFMTGFLVGVISGTIVGAIGGAVAITAFYSRARAEVTERMARSRGEMEWEAVVRGGEVEVGRLAGRRLRFDLSVEDGKGEAADLSELEGRVLFVNFWATWCAPCLAELPHIMRLAERRPEVTFVLISLDDRDRFETFLADRQQPSNVAMVRAAEEDQVRVRHGPLPLTLIVDQQGVVSMAEVGARDWNQAEVTDLLDGLVAGRTRTGQAL